jgi:colicin import membrane protein
MAQSFVITTQDDYQLAGEELQSIKGRILVLEGKRTGITGPMNKALTAINDLFRGPMATLKAAENAVKSSMLTYSEEQERLAAEERRIAEAVAAAERARIAEAARQVELAAAAERKLIADKAAAVAAAAKVEQDRLAQVAAEAAAAGNKAAQEEANRAADASRQASLLEAQQAQERDIEAQTRSAEAAAALCIETAVISAAVTNISSAKAAGTSIKVVVDYEVTSLISLVRHIAANPALINLVMEDSVKLRAYVRGLGLNTELPGVRVFQKRTMSARAA